MAADARTLHPNGQHATLNCGICRCCGDEAAGPDGWHCKQCFLEVTLGRRNPRHQISPWRLSAGGPGALYLFMLGKPQSAPVHVPSAPSSRWEWKPRAAVRA